jgi:hypothetical protein
MTFIEEKIFQDKKRNMRIYENHSADFIFKVSWWYLLNESSFMIREWTWPFTKCSRSILLARRCDGIYWKELFHVKRTNITDYKKLPVDFIGTESWWHLFNWSSSTINEITWLFTKGSRSILLARSRDDIYWMGALQRYDIVLDSLRNVLGPFYCHRDVIAFINVELLHDKRTNLLFPKATFDFIVTEWWWHLFKWSSS